MATNRRPTTIDDVAGECLAVRMRIINRVVTNIYDDALRPLDLKVSQMNILVATARMEVARPAEICRRLHLDVSTLSRNVERMKARGWLETVSDDDRRAQPFRLSSNGHKLLRRALPAWKQAQQQATTLLGDDMATHLDNTLRRINATEILG